MNCKLRLLLFTLPFICGLLWLFSTLSFTVAKKFKNGIELKLDIKGKNVMVFICVGMMCVLGMVPTGGVGCCSRIPWESNA